MFIARNRFRVAAGREPAFEEVREDVSREFDYERQRAARDATYEALRSRYEVVYADTAGDAT